MQQFGLIGKSLQHSFSAEYFKKKFITGNISNCRYDLFPISKIEDLPLLISSKPELTGFNVTIPYKKSILPYLDQMDEVAQEVGAVNTVKIFREKEGIFLKGFNTDVFGFEFSTDEFKNVGGALILGSGGAAEAVGYVLTKLGIPFLVVSGTSAGSRTIGYEKLTGELVRSYPMIVNATPVGMFPDVLNAPAIPYNDLTPRNFLYDLIYNPPETLFLKKGRQAGAKTLNGLKMLQMQADKSWEIWNSAD
jgi:shikimate dehydrogenase